MYVYIHIYILYTVTYVFISCYTSSSRSISEISREKTDSLYKLVSTSAMSSVLLDSLVSISISSLTCILSCCFVSLLNKIYYYIFIAANNESFNICVDNAYIYTSLFLGLYSLIEIAPQFSADGIYFFFLSMVFQKFLLNNFPQAVMVYLD